MKEILAENGISEQNINLIDYALEYAGKSKRSGDLFENKDTGSKMKKFLKTFDNVPNIFASH